MSAYFFNGIVRRIYYCCEGAIDFAQSHNGRKQIIAVVIPLFILGSLMMLITGAIWTRLLIPTCGINFDSASFSIYSDFSSGHRKLVGNSCPGYNWKSKSTVAPGEIAFSYSIAISPKISETPIYVDNSNPIQGIIGVAVNGIPIYSPSTGEPPIFDSCGGYVAANTEFSFDAPIPGYYHYHFMPGQQKPNPIATSSSQAQFCGPSDVWYNNSNTNSHSQIAGFLADGIPIYGPYGNNGVVPEDLDECGGHSSDLPYYHYHFQNQYPYSVSCIKGCADGSVNAKIRHSPCHINDSASFDYSSLASFAVNYGGDGVNKLDNAGPASLLAFGFAIFVPTSLCGVCFYCDNKMREKSHPLARDEATFDLADANNDNIL